MAAEQSRRDSQPSGMRLSETATAEDVGGAALSASSARNRGQRRIMGQRDDGR